MLALTPSASHLVVGSRSLSMRTYSLSPSATDAATIHVEHMRMLKPHTSPVVTLDVDATGALLATGGADGVVKVWDIVRGYVTHTFHGHGAIVSALRFFRVDGQGQESNTSKKSSKSKHARRDSISHHPSAHTLRLASGTEDGKIRVWNLSKRSASIILEGHLSVVRALDFSPASQALISGSRDRTIVVWDARTWKVRRTTAALEGLEGVGFLCDGQIAFSGGEHGRVRLWRVADGNEITKEQPAGTETEAIVHVLHQGGLPHLLSVHADQTFVFHSLAPLNSLPPGAAIDPLPVVGSIFGTHDEVIDLARVGRDGSLLALATNSEDVRIVSTAEASAADAQSRPGRGYFGASIATLKGHGDMVICLDVDWSGHWLATGAKDNTARLWRIAPDKNSYACFAVLTGHAEALGAIALPHHPPPSTSAAFADPLSHPPTFLLTGSQDKTIKRWDTTDKGSKKGLRATYTRKAHDKDINAIDVDETASLFASASQDRTVKIYSADDGETLGILKGHRRGVWCVQFAPQRNQAGRHGAKGLVATGSGDKTVKVWSLSDYSCLMTLEGHTNSVLQVAWLPLVPLDARDKRGPQLASSGGDGLVKIWDTDSGEAMSTLDNHTDRVWALATPQAAASSSTLVSGGADGVVTFWEDTTQAELAAATTAETQRIELDQQFQNCAHAGNYREAIALALQMDQPGRLLTLFKSVVEGEAAEHDTLSGSHAVDDVLAHLSDEQLATLLLRIRDWNTNARTAHVAQRILWAIVKSYPATRLARLKVAGGSRGGGGGGGGGLGDVVDAVKAYTERHYRRIEELVDESYLLDFTLREMDHVAI